MQKIIILLLSVVLQSTLSNAQSFDKLKALKDHAAKIYYSDGHEQRAEAVALRLDKSIGYISGLVDFKPDVTVLILSPADWSLFTKFPVYGMPHYNNDKILVVAAEDNAYWKSFIPPLEHLPEELRKQIQKTYGQKDGTVSMQAFFDLLALHELGHAFHMQAGLTMQRKWMGELFCNILLHTYIAENEPEQLAALTLFPNMVVGGGVKQYKFTSLIDFENKQEEIATQHPKNYGWYQCRLHSAAASIYDACGKEVLRKLWDALRSTKEKLTDTALTTFLEISVHITLADVMRKWDAEAIK